MTTTIRDEEGAPGILPVIAVDRAAAQPLYRQIYEGYREAIVERPAARAASGCPRRAPSRASSADLAHPRPERVRAAPGGGLHREPVGSGTFVASTPARRRPAAERPPRRREAPGRARAPVGEGGRPRVRATGPEPWLGGFGRLPHERARDRPLPVPASGRRLVARHCRNAPAQPARTTASRWGTVPLREALAAYLRTARAVRCEAEQIMVVSGSQQALEISARVLLDPGQPVWIEEPGYAGARDVLAHGRGARWCPCRSTTRGWTWRPASPAVPSRAGRATSRRRTSTRSA